MENIQVSQDPFYGELMKEITRKGNESPLLGKPNFQESQNPLYCQPQKKIEMHILPDDSLFKGSHMRAIMEEEKKKLLKRSIFQEQNMLKARFKKEDLEKKLQNLGKNQKFYLFLYF